MVYKISFMLKKIIAQIIIQKPSFLAFSGRPRRSAVMDQFRFTALWRFEVPVFMLAKVIAKIAPFFFAEKLGATHETWMKTWKSKRAKGLTHSFLLFVISRYPSLGRA